MARVKHIGPQSPEWYASARQRGLIADEPLMPCGCPPQFVTDCGHQEGCSVRPVHVVAEIDTSEPPTWSQGPDYSVNHVS
jgi:hypothetical protein